MALEIEAIQERKVALEGDLSKLRDTIAQLDAKRQELVNNLNALHGAVQQCDQFLVDIAKQEEEPKTKKEKRKHLKNICLNIQDIFLDNGWIKIQFLQLLMQ